MYQSAMPQKTVKILNGNVQMQILQQKLKLAIKEEKYEQASAIKKEIESFKSL